MRSVACIAILTVVTGCAAAPCEPPELTRSYPPPASRPLELLIVVDGAADFADERVALEDAWRRVLEYALYQRRDGEAAYLHERVRIRFVAAAPDCAPPTCDGRSVAEWERVSLARDDAAFEAQALCLWRSVPECGESRPVEALLSALESEPPDPRAALKTIIVSGRDDASSIAPSLAASLLVERGAGARFHMVGVASGPPIDDSCRDGGLDTNAVPRLAALVDALRPRVDRVHASSLCTAAENGLALGWDTATADYRARPSYPLARDEHGAVRCTVEERLPAEGRVTRCSDLAHLGRTLLRTEADGREVCAIEQRPARDGHGWYHDPAWSQLRFVEGSEPAPEAEVRLRCPAEARACTTDAECEPALPESPEPIARCDPEHGVCVVACEERCGWPGDACSRVDPDRPGWCIPNPLCK